MPVNLSKKTRRNLAVFNQRKFSPSRIKYTIGSRTSVDSYTDAFKSVKDLEDEEVLLDAEINSQAG